MNSTEKLVYMANQIARNMSTMDAGTAEAVADHIAHFWDPRMKAMIFAHIDAGGQGLDADALSALRLLRDEGAPGAQTRATKFAAAEGAAERSDAG